MSDHEIPLQDPKVQRAGKIQVFRKLDDGFDKLFVDLHLQDNIGKDKALRKLRNAKLANMYSGRQGRTIVPILCGEHGLWIWRPQCTGMMHTFRDWGAFSPVLESMDPHVRTCAIHVEPHSLIHPIDCMYTYSNLHVFLFLFSHHELTRHGLASSL